MIKKLLVAMLIAFPMCLAAQTFKFGTVNSQEIFNLMPDKATAETTLQSVAEKYQAELQNFRKNLIRNIRNSKLLTKRLLNQ